MFKKYKKTKIEYKYKQKSDDSIRRKSIDKIINSYFFNTCIECWDRSDLIEPAGWREGTLPPKLIAEFLHPPGVDQPPRTLAEVHPIVLPQSSTSIFTADLASHWSSLSSLSFSPTRWSGIPLDPPSLLSRTNFPPPPVSKIIPRCYISSKLIPDNCCRFYGCLEDIENRRGTVARWFDDPSSRESSFDDGLGSKRSGHGSARREKYKMRAGKVDGD